MTQFQRYCVKYVITVTVTDTHNNNTTLFYLLFLQIEEYKPSQNNERKHSLNPTVLLSISVFNFAGDAESARFSRGLCPFTIFNASSPKQPALFPPPPPPIHLSLPSLPPSGFLSSGHPGTSVLSCPLPCQEFSQVDRSREVEAGVVQMKRAGTVFVNQWAASGGRLDEERCLGTLRTWRAAFVLNFWTEDDGWN